VANGDAPGDGAAGSAAGGSSREEAAWLDLVANFDAPVPEDGDAPWPEREDLTGSVPVTPALPDSAEPAPGSPETQSPGPDSPGSGSPGSGSPGPGSPAAGPPANPGARLPTAGPGHGPRDTSAPADPAEEHFVPPKPPPLPKLDSATKLAWLALFGGPCYLLVSTVVGWPVSGLAVFLCVAAFVGGFAVLVLRMDNGGPRDSGPDDGAVV
jgi:hypothetical protein